MAWITSATNGTGVSNGHLRLVQAVLLVAHLTLLVLMLFDRQGVSNIKQQEHAPAGMTPEFVTSSTGSAPLAMVSGLMLALLMLAANRTRAVAARSTGAAPAPINTALGINQHRLPDHQAPQAHDGLLARLNHDLRTPLNAIIGFADLMKAEAFGPLGNDRYRAYADHMQTCGHELLRATESTLAMASLLANPADGGGDVIDLDMLVNEAWQATNRNDADKCVSLTLTLESDLRVRGNFPALRQSLVNLLGLACERRGEGSHVQFGANRSHGRVLAWISVSGGNCHQLAPRTGCRPRSSGTGEVDELAIGMSRTLLGLHGVPLVETCNRPGEWTITMSLEDAAQADFFEQPSRALPYPTVIARAPGRDTSYSTAFFGGMPVAASGSA